MSRRLIIFGRFAIASLVLLLALVLSHKFLPAGRRSLRDIAPGILLTFVLWIAASIAFGSYLADFARNYATTYAGLASVMIALVLLYMISANALVEGSHTAYLDTDELLPPACSRSAYQWLQERHSLVS